MSPRPSCTLCEVDYLGAGRCSTCLYVEFLRSEIYRLQATVSDAAEMVADWGAYAGEYFQQKHDLEGDIASLRFAATSEMP